MAYETVLELSADKEKCIQLGKSGKVGEQVEGYYLGVKTFKSQYRTESKLHILQTPDGNIGLYGTGRLNYLLKPELVGNMIEVTFIGMRPSSEKGRQPAYDYRVRQDKANSIDVSGIVGNASEPQVSEDEYPEDREDEGQQSYTSVARPVATRTAPITPNTVKLNEMLNKTRTQPTGRLS